MLRICTLKLRRCEISLENFRRIAHEFRITLNDSFGKQKVAVRDEVRYDYIQPAAARSFLIYPGENRLLTEGRQIPLQGTAHMFDNVGRVRRQQALRYKSDVQGSALQLDVQEVDQFVHADGVGPHGAPETGRP